jgi:hypothetical protein
LAGLLFAAAGRPARAGDHLTELAEVTVKAGKTVEKDTTKAVDKVEHKIR